MQSRRIPKSMIVDAVVGFIPRNRTKARNRRGANVAIVRDGALNVEGDQMHPFGAEGAR